MKTILVPTDFSDGAYNALTHALELARLLKYNVEVIHAYSMPPTGSAVMVNITEILEKNAIEELELLKRKVSKLSYSTGLSINYKALHGSVVDVINRMSREKGFEFVVMGTKGASGISDKWLGTNAAEAAKNVEDPLLIIPSNHTYKNIDNILFATDLIMIENEKHLRFLSELSKVSNAKIVFLNIRKEGVEVDQEKLNNYRNQLDRTFGIDRAKIMFRNSDQVNEGIKQGIKDINPDVLAVVRHDYGFFQGLFRSSVSRELISQSELPIIVLQDK